MLNMIFNIFEQMNYYVSKFFIIQKDLNWISISKEKKKKKKYFKTLVTNTYLFNMIYRWILYMSKFLIPLIRK